MKKYIIIAFIGFAGKLSAQQMSLNSQYLFNEILVNPAAVGTKEYVPVQLNFRKQWNSFPGAPVTQSMSCHSSVFKQMGIGGSIFNDVAGPSRRTGFNFSSAYHLRLDNSKNQMLGVGFGLSMTQHLIDVSKLTTYLSDDPAVTRGFNNQLVPDANVGAFYRYKNKLSVGLSAYNLVQSKRDLYHFEDALRNTMKRMYYLYASYNFDINESFNIKTTTLVQAIETGTTQFDVTAIGTFRKMIWLGTSYRHTDAVAILAGCQIKGFRLGYSYDITLSDIGKYSNGSHEVFIELQLFKNNAQSKNPWLKRNRIYSPGR